MKNFLNKICFNNKIFRWALYSIFGAEKYDVIINQLGIDFSKAFAAADFGAGSGRIALKITAEAKCRILYALDYNEDYLEIIAASAKKSNTLHKIEFIETDIAKNLKMKNDSVDYGFCGYVFSYNPKETAEKILKNISEVMVTGGKIYLTDFISRNTIRRFEVPFPYKIDELKNVIEKNGNLKIISANYKKYTQSYILEKC